MSYTLSNLSDAHYGYDMVTGVTQTSVNATMMKWLSGYQGSLFTQAYVYDEKTKLPVLTDYDTLMANLGFDPFTVNTLTDSQNTALLGQKFMFAFQIEIGLPNFPLDKIPLMIVLNQEGSTVTYNMVCKTFKIIDLQANNYGPSTWINLDQSTGDAPWQIQFNVVLNLVKDSFTNKFHLLPINVQNEIKNLGEDMFSVQQLYFDLNTAALSSSFKVVGLDSSSQASVYLTTVFLKQYVTEIAKDGGIMLGFGVVSDRPFPKNVSLVPTDLNFVVSAYKEVNGKNTTDFSAYTLNYLIMANKKTMPPAVPFAWNWVDKDNLSAFAGSVAINRNTFANFLNTLLSPSLSTITYDPKVTFSTDLTKFHLSTDFTKVTGPFNYNTVPTGGSNVLTYTYSKTSKDSVKGVNSGYYYLKYTTKSNVYLEGTQIKNVTKVTAYAHISIDKGDAKGNWAVYSLTTYYNIGVNAQGAISVTLAKDPIDNQSVTPDPSTWAEIITFGTINNVVDSLQSYLQDRLRNIVTEEPTTIANMLNGSNTWVFPGSKTFTFQNAEFSKYQDMVAHVLYADPNG